MENNQRVTISYAITVKDELEEITKLLNFFQLSVTEHDEIVIQYDSSGVTDEVKDYLNIMENSHD